eukprot:TRINITY_DN4390_c0_g1_i1.p1 TRINITY_DN4390_c0_g1~~TRINITY_DN4390_c0_g1_i1.p1  ORF type:complete len:181 (-),score=50.20 TRINITY_DN4390_c0_g1_i1:497-1039(-)
MSRFGGHQQLALGSSSSQTVSVPNELGENAQTLVLRLKVKAQDIKSNADAIREELRDMDADDVDAFIEDQFRGLKREVNEGIDDMENKIKSKKPKKEPGKSKEDYEKEMSEYKVFVGHAVTVIEKLSSFFASIIKSCTEFFHNLWNWIKQALSDIATRVKKFCDHLAELAHKFIENVFDW